jgi:ADP-ribose pyrophosphatase
VASADSGTKEIAMDEKWKVLEEDTVFAAHPYVEIVRQTIRTGSGDVVPDFYQVRLRPFSICVPITEAGRIVMIRQYKHGAGRITLTFPAGFRNADEAAEDACRRELREETGLVAADLIHLGEFVDNGNQRGCVGNYFIARGCRKVTEPDSGDLEKMEVVELDPNEIDTALAAGQIAVIHHAAVWAMARLERL